MTHIHEPHAVAYRYRVSEVLRVVDGDTVDLIIDLGFGVQTRQRCRLAGVDAPEVRGSERPQGLAASAWLNRRLSAANSPLTVHTRKQGKFGRWLATLFDEGGCLNEQLIQAGHATRYAG